MTEPSARFDGNDVEALHGGMVSLHGGCVWLASCPFIMATVSDLLMVTSTSISGA